MRHLFKKSNRSAWTQFIASGAIPDTTAWLYDAATGLLLAKAYADGNGPSYTYADNGNLATRTWACGVVTTYSYDITAAQAGLANRASQAERKRVPSWNNLTNTAYSDDTPAVSLAYDAFGRQTNAVDAVGTTVTAYDAFGDVASESVSGLYSRSLLRHRDAFGRDLGYSLNNSRKNIIEYEADTGRIRRVMFAGAWYTYSYLPGTDLKASLAVGSAGRTDWTYEPSRDLLAQVRNTAFGSVVSQYDYVSDALGRRTEISRSGTMMSESRTDSYAYNARSELTNAVRNATLNEYAYQYDDIGNRLSSLDLGTNRTYVANSLNQYTSISGSAGGPPAQTESFAPQFDLDGNQTLIRTSTGDWSVTYNAENRPVLWSCGTTNIVMAFDRMGRRVEYLETVAVDPGGAQLDSTVTTNTHHRFVYDGYLCIQRLNAAANNAIDLAFGWDPTEPVATRPLWIQRPTGNYNFFCFHDGNKNVSDVVSYQSAYGVAAHYEYAPFGAVTATSRSTPVTAYDFREYNPFRFSAEYADITLSQCCYTYRNYNTLNGRWCSRDSVEERGGVNLYAFVKNRTLDKIDTLGQYSCSCSKEEICKTAYGVGPYDAYKAKKLSDEAFRVARSAKDKNGQKLPDPHNGRQDAFRHCYWSCRMAQELSKEEAKIVGDNHEICAQGQPQAEKGMDDYNNKMGRDAPKNTDCKTYCLDLLEHGKLITLK